jgi:glucosamine-6-phosphate deaminase
MISSGIYGKLRVTVCEDRAAMGRAAAERAAACIRETAAAQGHVSVIFAAAPSQNEFLGCLAAAPGVPWEAVHAFHMDEYIGLPEDAPQLFSAFLTRKIFSRVPFGSVSLISSRTEDPERECARYASLLGEHPPDLVCMGIGENGHIAFNDPHVARFDDEKMVKVVELDYTSRMQQVHDGCFASIEEVPAAAVTLTIPALTAARQVVCVVPGPAKAAAVTAALTGPVSEECPASILRNHQDADLFLDPGSAASG